jgi:rod shape determining protein RodA
LCYNPLIPPVGQRQGTVFDSRFFRRADLVLLGVALTLVAIGCLMVYSCTRAELTERGLPRWTVLRTQLVWVALGLVALFLMMSFDYTRLGGLYLPVYGVALLLLLVVLAMPEVRGTHRWLVLGPLRLQPAELAQLAVLLTVCSVAAAHEGIHDFLGLARNLAWVVVPVGLILLEPDLGTPVVMLVTWGVVMYVAGVRWTHLASFAFAGALLFSAAWYSGAIRQYQKDRLLIFLHPERDPTGDGYHLVQSLIAIGHGGPFGQGLFQGTQTRLHFIPDQETDFIFTAVAEEMGFVGGALVLALFGVLI